MAVVSLEIDEYNSLTEIKDKYTELKLKYENDIEKIKLEEREKNISYKESCDEKIKESEERMSKIIIDLNVSPFKLNDFEELKDFSYLFEDELSNQNSVIKKKTYVNFEDIKDSIYKDIEKLNKEKQETDKEKYESEIRQLENTVKKYKNICDEQEKNNKKIIEDRIEYTNKQCDAKINNLKETITEFENKLVESNKNYDILYKEYQNNKIEYKKHRDELKREKYDNGIIENELSTTIDQLKTTSLCVKELKNKIKEKENNEEEIKKHYSDLEKELKSKFNIYSNSKVIVVKDYDDLSFISKKIINRLYKNKNIINYNHGIKRENTIKDNDEFLNELNFNN